MTLDAYFMTLRQLARIAARPTLRHLHALLLIELLPIRGDMP
jgi:hypothetical protein